MLDKRKAERQTPRHRQHLEGFKKVGLFSTLLEVVGGTRGGTSARALFRRATTERVAAGKGKCRGRPLQSAN